ncbi:hypothetical protein [Candidatus Formimonas warabiya]|uniref:hypothetical protein n=1 Tax=Formimonas warabiya TaxID=1761012 RepID=UPI0011D14021|nr:hypothetical protein [Candidatus Formimonas warabiya]
MKKSILAGGYPDPIRWDERTEIKPGEEKKPKPDILAGLGPVLDTGFYYLPKSFIIQDFLLEELILGCEPVSESSSSGIKSWFGGRKLRGCGWGVLLISGIFLSMAVQLL